MESQPTPSDTASSSESAPLAAFESEIVLPYQAGISRRDLGLAVGAGVAYLALFVITLRIPFGQTPVLIATLISLGLVLLFTVSAARALRRPLTLALWTLLSGAISLPYVLIPILFARFPTWTGWPNVGLVYEHYKQNMAHVPGLHGLMLILFAVCLGVWLSRLMREMKILLPIAVVLACMDLYVVFGGGLVTQAHTGKAPVAQAAMKSLTVSLTGPSIPKTGAAPLQLSVGFADFLFIALFFACLARFRVPSARTFLVLCATLLVYLACVYVFRVDLPALVPIAVVVVGMNLRQFRYERSEAFALLYAGLIVAAILGGMLFLAHR